MLEERFGCEKGGCSGDGSIFKRSQKVLWEGMQMLMNSLACAWTLRYATDDELANPIIGATYKKWMKFPSEFVGRRLGGQPSDQ